jgi:hypothetical protein
LDEKYRNLAIWKTYDHLFQSLNFCDFAYQGYDPKFRPKHITLKEDELPENLKPDSPNNHIYSYNDSSDCYGEHFKDYVPPIAREAFQISLWKYDNFGLVKIKDRYFTPKSDIYKDPEFLGFKIQPSLDGTHLLISENIWDSDEKQTVLVMDAYNFEIKNEIEIQLNEHDFEIDEDYEQTDEDYLNFDEPFPTDEHVPRSMLFGNGKYIITAVSKTESILHYYYKITDVEAKKVVHKIERVRQLRDHWLMSMQIDPKDNTQLYASLFKKGLISIIRIDALNGTFQLVAENKTIIEDLVKDIRLDQDWKQVFVNFTFDTSETEKHIVVKYNIGDSSEINKSKIKDYKSSMPTIWHASSTCENLYIRSCFVNEEIYFDIHGAMDHHVSYIDKNDNEMEEIHDVCLWKDKFFPESKINNPK